MKVALGFHVLGEHHAWGGGNQFANGLQGHLRNLGHRVESSLGDQDIDVILLTNPNGKAESAAFGADEVATYVRQHPQTKVLHRVNDCDARKGTWMVNYRHRRANQLADATVFLSDWLRVHYGGQWAAPSVIHNGACGTYFRPDPAMVWTPKQPLKIVTHHWSPHLRKGADVYLRLDELCGRDKSVQFTYIGRSPYMFNHATMMQPLPTLAVAQELRKHHVYLSGSQDEPGGMHQVEGLASGLPVLYRLSGSLPEYCAGYGIGFTGPDDFEDAIQQMKVAYDWYRPQVVVDAMLERFSGARMCRQYSDLLDRLVGSAQSRVVSASA